MITYQRQNDEIILQMSIGDWERLLMLMGYAAGAAKAAGEEKLFWEWIQLANEMNLTNPAFTPYEIPEAYR